MPVSIFGTTSNVSSKVAQKISPGFPDASQFLKHDGSVPTTAPLNMNGNTINNLQLPIHQTDAANREYVDMMIDRIDTIIRNYVNERIRTTIDDELKGYIEDTAYQMAKVMNSKFKTVWQYKGKIYSNDGKL